MIKKQLLPMMRKIIYRDLVLILVSLSAIFLYTCDDHLEINLVTFDDQIIGANPVILNVSPPADSAFAAYTVITLLGENFSPDSGHNVVYFNGTQAQVLDQSEAELVVLAPSIVGEDLTIKVIVEGALEIATIPYSLANLSMEYGGLGNAEKTRCFAIDTAENLFIMLDDRTVIKITPDGVRATFGTTTAFPSASEMRVGPDGALYLQRVSQKMIYRIAPEGGDALEYITFPDAISGNSVRLVSFDFDSKGNIYAGGISGGLIVYNVNGNSYGLGDYNTGVKIRSVRVVDDYVYLATETDVWRNRIVSDTGLVSINEQIFDWDDAGTMAGSDIKSITLSADGDLYIGTSNTSATTLDPILIVHPDGTSEPLYPGQLTLPADHLVWGNGNFLYVNRANRDSELRRIIRVNMLKEGAPYNGRTL